MFNKKKMYIFLLLLPIIDLITSLMTRLYNPPLSLGIVIKVLFLAIMLFYLFFRSTSKYKKLCIGYIFLIFIYIILYYVSKIKYLTINGFVTETMYLAKILYFPILLSCLFCYFDDNKLSKGELDTILKITLIMYCVLLFVPLITNTGFDTYVGGDIPGKVGWFFAGNEISIILVLLFPYIYSILKTKKSYWVILPIVIILIISTIGTKASMVGIIIDCFIIFLISLFYKTNKNNHKKIIIFSSILFIASILIFSTSNSLDNFKMALGIQDKEVSEKVSEKTTKKTTQTTTKKQKKKTKIEKEIAALEEELNKKVFLGEFINKYGGKILSGRNKYYGITYLIQQKNMSAKTLFLGLGYVNTSAINNKRIEKLIEVDPLDIYFHSGLIAFIIVFLPYLYYLFKLIKLKKLNSSIIYYSLMLGMIFCISCISGHAFIAPAVSIYISLYFILAFYELGLINTKKQNIEKNKVSIYALHLNYGGIERDVINKANMLSKNYNVEIISVYNLLDKLPYNIKDNVKITYLNDKKIYPNKSKFLKALKSKNIFNIFKEGLYSVKVLYYKNNMLIKSMIDCNSEIIISTRADFSLKLINYNNYKNIKIAQEHIYHNNKKTYFKKLKKILNGVDYLMPSSNYLTNYYKEKYTKYAYKIVTNQMFVETDGSISNLDKKSIISVGRLSKEKGFDDLIYLFKEVSYKHPNWELNIVGDGKEKSNLKSLIKELDLNDKVKILGFKNSLELNEIYCDSSIYVMTSLEESFGLVLLEAASHGLPIVAFSSALGACEILSDDKGILIKDRNKEEMIKSINSLIDDENMRKEYQKRSLDIAKKYSFETVESYNIEFFSNIHENGLFNNLYLGTKKEFYDIVKNKLKNKEKTFIVTSNPETYMLARSDIEMNNLLYDHKNLIIPDGASVVKCANYLGYKVKKRITGVDLAEYLLELANEKKYKVYLFGAKEEIIEKFENIINKKYPKIKLVGATNGYIKDKRAVMEYISTTKPDVVLVGMGIPLQEKLIYENLSLFDKGIFVGVGGAFDVLSGKIKRAPKIFILLNLEWLYRILREPKRIVRFIKYNIRFLFKVFKEKH